MKLNILLLVITLGVSFACQPESSNDEVHDNPLPSWNEGTTKTEIIEFVEAVTDPGNPDFVPIAERIAVFDNDGNLWSEQPAYFQLFFAMDRIKTLAEEHPEWKETQPYKSILENDIDKFMSFGTKGILEIVMASHAGVTTEDFEKIVRDWINTARHPRFDKPYTSLIYQPMLELLDYLRANNFKTFIVSGGGLEFMRPWVEEAYGIPKDQVVGSSIKTEFHMTEEGPVLLRLPELDFLDDGPGKPVAINRFIGQRPIFSSGNSDGDLPMMQWTAAGKNKRFMLYLHHTDSVREWAYDRESHIGRLDKGLDEANQNGWTVIDMAKDWKVIYPFELTGHKSD